MSDTSPNETPWKSRWSDYTRGYVIAQAPAMAAELVELRERLQAVRG